MAYYNKIGLLVLNTDATKFLVCEPALPFTNSGVSQYLMPGGTLEQESEIECLTREVKEELGGCGVDMGSLKYVGEYNDVSATHPERDVTIRLYQGSLLSEPKPSMEIGALHWIGKEDASSSIVSPIIRNKIVPDLVKRGIVK